MKRVLGDSLRYPNGSNHEVVEVLLATKTMRFEYCEVPSDFVWSLVKGRFVPPEQATDDVQHIKDFEERQRQMRIDKYIAFECKRQHTTNVDEMNRAFEWVRCPGVETIDFSKFVMCIANLVEPEKNDILYNGQEYSNVRTSEVGFASGGSASKAIDVERHFSRWADLYSLDFTTEEVDAYIKQFLDIHPFADGNGRTASILRNWMLGKMDDPEILPYYYGEK